MIILDKFLRSKMLSCRDLGKTNIFNIDYNIIHLYQKTHKDVLFILKNKFCHKLIDIEHGNITTFYNSVKGNHSPISICYTNKQSTNEVGETIKGLCIAGFNQYDNIYNLTKLGADKYYLISKKPSIWEIIVGNTILSYNNCNDPSVEFKISFPQDDVELIKPFNSDQWLLEPNC